ncbi:MAG: SCO family protein [Verrucomicrobiales bacterium]|nr:SCO family protein [Verrucomicrobiales bacterium]
MDPSLTQPASGRRDFLSFLLPLARQKYEDTPIVTHEDGYYETRLHQGRIGSYLEWPAFAATDHQGRTVDIHRDVIAGQPVVLSFFYTRCKGSCPVTTGRMIDLAATMEAAGRRVRFISITLEPEFDTPAELATYAKNVLPEKADWRLLHTLPETLIQLRRHFGFYDLNPAIDADPRRHAAMVLIGDDRTHRWITLPAIATLRQWRSALSRCAA